MEQELLEPMKEEHQSRDTLCRLCACSTELLLPIFEGEGLENSLSDKIVKYLPIQIAPSDVLPVKICFQCASTVISYHELTETCLEAEAKLKLMFGDNCSPQLSPLCSKDSTADNFEESGDMSRTDDHEPSSSASGILSDHCREEMPETSEGNRKNTAKGGDTERFIADVTEDDDVMCIEVVENNQTVTDIEKQSEIDHCYTRGKENISETIQPRRNLSTTQSTFQPRLILPPPLVPFAKSSSRSTAKKKPSETIAQKKSPQLYIVYKPPVSSSNHNPIILQHSEPSAASSKTPSKNSVDFLQKSSVVQPVLATSQTSNIKSVLQKQRPILPKSSLITLPKLKGVTVTRVPASSPKKTPVKTVEKASVTVIKGGNFTCSICSAKFINEMVFKRHMFLTHNVLKHVCSICHAAFGKKFDLDVHFRRVHRNPETKPKPSCKICNVTFEKVSDVRLHVREKHTSNVPRFERFFKEKRPVLGVPITEKEAALLRDCYARVDNRDVYNCTLCSKSWPSLDKAVAHIRTHTKEFLYSCETCGQRFNSRGVMIRHLQVHKNVKPFACDYCDKSFSSKQNRDDHHRFHTKEVKTVCESCGEFLTSASMLYYHRKIHSGVNPYKCPYCEKAYSIRSLLKRHIRFHTGEKPHLCSECGRAFKTSGQLRGHSAVHTDARPFPCEGCGAMMKTKKYLNRHRAICANLRKKSVSIS